jgi:hypothetical protein
MVLTDEEKNQLKRTHMKMKRKLNRNPVHLPPEHERFSIWLKLSIIWILGLLFVAMILECIK